MRKWTLLSDLNLNQNQTGAGDAMKLPVKIQLLKFCCTVLNCIFMLLGLSVAGCGVWILFGAENFLTVVQSVELTTVAFGLLVVGAVVVLVSVVGCVGTDREHRFLLLLYLGFLIVLVLGQLFVTLLLLVNRDKVQRTLEDHVDQMIIGYQGNSSDDRLLDNLQRYVGCCGRTEPSDWLENRFLQTEHLNRPGVLPCSCFSSSPRRSNSSFCSNATEPPPPPLGHGNNSYTQGCWDSLSAWLQENVLTIVGMDVGLVFIQMFQFGLMLSLYRAVTTKASLKRSNQLADADHAHLGHAPSDYDDLDPGEQNYAYIHPDDPAYYYDTIDPADHHDNQVYLQPAQ